MERFFEFAEASPWVAAIAIVWLPWPLAFAACWLADILAELLVKALRL